MNRAWLYGVFLSLSLILSGCVTARNYPGQVQENNQRLATTSELADELSKADVVILGEFHDNLAHHETQLAVLQELHEKGWLKQLALEMLTPSQQMGADKAVKERISNPEQLRVMLNWERGWDWQLYGPIVSWATSEGIPLVAANLDEGEKQTVRDQPERLGKVVLGEHGLTTHKKQFRSSHCGHTNPAREETMLRVQVARDARMAASLLSRVPGTALLAGNWHVRNDIGVPRYVLAQRPDIKILTVGMAETPQPVDADFASRYDITWGSEGVERPDFCEMFRKGHLKKP